MYRDLPPPADLRGDVFLRAEALANLGSTSMQNSLATALVVLIVCRVKQLITEN